MTPITLPIEFLQPLLIFLVLILLVKSGIFLFLKGTIFEEIRKFQLVNKLPGPKRYPVLGNIFEAFADDVTIFNKQRKWAKEHSPVYALMAYPYYLVNFTGPEDIEKLLSTKTHNTKSFLYDFMHTLVAEGLFTSNGAKWQQRRKLLNSAFHVNVLQQFVSSFQKQGENLADDFEKAVETGNNVVDVVDVLYLHGVKAVREMITEKTSNEHNNEDKAYTDSLKYYIDLLPYRAMRPWLHNNFVYYNLTRNGSNEKKAIKLMHDFTNKILYNRMNEMKLKPVESADKKHMPILDLLINAKNEGKIDSTGLQEEFIIFMIAGFDTTATSMGFTLMLLANNQSAQQNIIDEINDIIPDPNEDLTIQKLNELKYLERCIKESLRLYPSGPFISRVVSEDFVTHNNFKIPKGTVANILIYDLHRNPDVFPDPEKFDPDRFLIENVKDRHPYAYIPFSAGPRNCIGQKYAMLEMKIFLVNILRKFKLEPVDTPESLVVYGQTFLRVKNGIRVKFVHRNEC